METSLNDNIHTFIFGNVFGGMVRPCCETFELCEGGLELKVSGKGEGFVVDGFNFVVFLAGVVPGSLNTIPITMAPHKHMKELKETLTDTMQLQKHNLSSNEDSHKVIEGEYQDVNNRSHDVTVILGDSFRLMEHLQSDMLFLLQ